MTFFYNLGILLYGWAIRLASPFNRKAKLWVDGRKGWEKKLARALGDRKDWIWMHCSSLGEFEQGRPLIEAIKQQYPQQKILLSFFSPSGYEIRKNFAHVDHVCYLPLDTRRNARTFFDIVQPKLVIYVKYDLWLNFIAEAEVRKIHQILVSAILRKDSKFLKSGLRKQYQRAFHAFSWIFTQDQDTHRLLTELVQIDRISVAGDTRFDRVAELPAKYEAVLGVEAFIAGRRCIVAGSPWPKDEAILLPVINKMRRPDLCWILAPHEIHPQQIDHHIDHSGGKMIKYSQISGASPAADVLWIDNVGMLSRLYHDAALVYIGGGFGLGIHNTQEAAVYGNPIIFGPNYQKFQEAVDMIAAGGAISVTTADELEKAILHWLEDASLMLQTRNANQEYIQSKTGATAAIMVKMHLLGFFPGDFSRSVSE